MLEDDKRLLDDAKYDYEYKPYGIGKYGMPLIALAEKLDARVVELELKYRRQLWLNHGHYGQYGDDGEMQCSECYGVGDYKRMPIEDLEQQFIKVNMETLAQSVRKDISHAT